MDKCIAVMGMRGEAGAQDSLGWAEKVKMNKGQYLPEKKLPLSL